MRSGFFQVIDKEKIVFDTILILSSHYKDGTPLKDENGQIKDYITDKLRGYSMAFDENMDIVPNEEGTYITERNGFSSRYFNYGESSYRELKFAVELISSGYFDEDLFHQEINQLKDYYSKDEKWNIAYNMFNNPLQNSTDEEYSQIQTEVFEWVKVGKYKYYELMTIANSYEIWNKEGIKFSLKKDEFFKLISNAFTDEIDYDMIHTSFPLHNEAQKNDYSKSYLELCEKGENIRIERWQELHEENINSTITSLEKNEKIDELVIFRILASNRPEDFDRLVIVLCRSVHTLSQLAGCYIKLISLFITDDRQTQIQKLKNLAFSIAEEVKTDTLKTYVFNNFKGSYLKTINRYDGK